MPKYMVQASFTAQGMKGLFKDTAAGRRAAIKESIESLGGKLELLYYAFGKDDVIAIVDLPGNLAAAALSAAAASSGMVRARTIPLLTVEEMDNALAKEVAYRAPGSGR